MNGSDAVAVQGRILQAPDEPKWVNITDRRTKQQELVPVITILLADRTGPIVLELWRNTAESLLQDLNAKEDPDDEGVIIEVRRCWVRTENKVCIPQTRKLASNERTSVVLLEVANQPSLVDESITISQSMYVRDFTQLSKKPPYQISIAGVISSIQPEITTRSGALMRSFRLQDNTGKWVACVAFDQAAENVVIANGNEVVMFFASAQEGLNNGPGQLWLYDRSHVVLLRVGCSAPPCRTQVEMRGNQ